MAEAVRRQTPTDALVEPVLGGVYPSGSAQPGSAQPGSAQPGSAQPGSGQAGSAQVDQTAVGPVEPPPLLDHTVLVVPPTFRPPDGVWAPWAVTLRRFARAAVWTLPAGMALLALTGVWGWPTPANEGEQSPGTWLVCTLGALVLAVVGVMALTALLALTPGAAWSMVAAVLVLPGTVLVAAVAGVVGLARPAASRLSGQTGPAVAANLEGRFFDGAVSRWLGVGGLVLLGAGWLCLAVAVLAAGVLNRVDGALLAAAVGVATLAAYAHWQFLVVLAAMLALAGALGLAFTASRLNPDGVPPSD